MEKQISNHSFKFLKEQFTILHNAVVNIRADKEFGDSLKRRIELLEDKNLTLAKEARELQDAYTKLMMERDSFRADTNLLYNSKKIIENQYAQDKAQNAEREANLKKLLTLANK